ncbi:MAG: hypothetical protein ACLSHC_05230 [Bilophila wadsworthia]
MGHLYLAPTRSSNRCTAQRRHLGVLHRRRATIIYVFILFGALLKDQYGQRVLELPASSPATLAGGPAGGPSSAAPFAAFRQRGGQRLRHRHLHHPAMKRGLCGVELARSRRSPSGGLIMPRHGQHVSSWPNTLASLPEHLQGCAPPAVPITYPCSP